MTKHQQTVSAGSRIYYFDLREDSKGTEYITITEMNARNQKRSCIYIFPEDIDNFRQALEDAAANVSKR